MFKAIFSLPRTVWLIGLISLVNDSASEMLYPLIPLYLTSVLMHATNEVGGHIRSVQESVRKSIHNTETTTQAIEESTELAHTSGAVLNEIVGMVDATADHVRGIATASEEQSAASEQISRSTEEINRIATETAEAMVQSGKAVGDLARLASELRGIINDMLFFTRW